MSDIGIEKIASLSVDNTFWFASATAGVQEKQDVFPEVKLGSARHC